MDSFFQDVCAPGGICQGVGIWLAALLTILVWTYLVHDTVLFRIASALLVGTAIGFVSAVVVSTVLLPLLRRLVGDLVEFNLFNLLIDLVPIALGAALLLKLTPNFRATTFSNVGLAYLIGIGAALAIGGALAGILVPQLVATIVSLAPQGDAPNTINALLLVIGTLGTFLAFRFVQPNDRPLQRGYAMVARVWGTIGRGFMMVAFGAILAGLVAARVAVLVGQLYFLLHDWLHLIG